MSINITIFEDNDRLRESLVYLLEGVEEYHVTGHFNNCSDAENIVRVYKPDVVLMDIDMPGINGIKGVSLAKTARPQTAVIMYTCTLFLRTMKNCFSVFVPALMATY
jgi:DNA-binding NarL/FixJ family response regulator